MYPSGVWAHEAARFDGFDEMWTRLWDNSVDVPGPHIDRFIKACAEHEIYCVLGVNERESARPGSLYNTMILLGPEGLLWKHRKLMPTMHERLFHGVGYGQDLNVTETPVGKVGGLIFGRTACLSLDMSSIVKACRSGRPRRPMILTAGSPQ